MRNYLGRRLFSILSFFIILIFILSSYPSGFSLNAAELYHYIDAGGTLKTVQATEILSGTQYLASGWYIVRGKVSTNNLRIEGAAVVMVCSAVVVLLMLQRRTWHDHT